MAASSIGDKIEDYNVLNLLGKGAFACVYRAKSLATGIDVAMKMIDKSAMQQAGGLKRVRNEVEIHCQLKHPAVLELYNYFEDQHYVYLVLEMCHNGEVGRFLKQRGKPFSEEQGCLADPNICGRVCHRGTSMLSQYSNKQLVPMELKGDGCCCTLGRVCQGSRNEDGVNTGGLMVANVNRAVRTDIKTATSNRVENIVQIADLKGQTVLRKGVEMEEQKQTRTCFEPGQCNTQRPCQRTPKTEALCTVRLKPFRQVHKNTVVSESVIGVRG
uniref:non-specific serine/threonine protein kinase n=1 Tax=Eptatretus burgeri TaxID=7764 RepID=A0A8C4NFJ0_EPTBU